MDSKKHVVAKPVKAKSAASKKLKAKAAKKTRKKAAKHVGAARRRAKRGPGPGR